MMRRLLLALASLSAAAALTGCSREGGSGAGPSASSTSPVAPASSARPSASPPAPPSALRPPPRPAPPASAPAHPATCEVEMTGRVRGVPPGKVASVLITYGDCLDEKAPLLGRTAAAADGKFFLEVFVTWGSDISFCAAFEPEPGKPSTLYARAPGPFHAEAAGEVEFKNVEVTLKPGPAHVFPTRFAAADAPIVNPR